MESIETHKCQYCNKTFKRERTLESHSCEPRRRYRSKKDKNVVIAYDIFNKFYKRLQHGSPDKSFNDFIKSQYYIGMVKYGTYCVNSKVINVARYGNFLLKNEVPLDKWALDSTYTVFLKQVIKIESVEDALTRTINYGLQWGEEKHEKSNNLFRVCPSNRIIMGISVGKISPWVLYHSSSGNEFMHENIRALETVWELIDPDFWEKKFADNKADVTFAKEMLTMGGW